jgi:hypothetical protein
MVEDFPPSGYIGKRLAVAVDIGRQCCYASIDHVQLTRHPRLGGGGNAGLVVAGRGIGQRRGNKGGGAADGREQVQLKITIEDSDSGLLVNISRRVPEGTTALDAMRATVAIETKDFKDLGQFVTSLCGVEPAKGKFWSPDVDGKRSPVGIAQIKIEKDMRLDWKTRDKTD